MIRFIHQLLLVFTFMVFMLGTATAQLTLENFNDVSTLETWLGSDAGEFEISNSEDAVDGLSLRVDYKVVGDQGWGGQLDVGWSAGLDEDDKPLFYPDITDYDAFRVYYKVLEPGSEPENGRVTLNVYLKSKDEEETEERWQFRDETILFDDPGEWQEFVIPFDALIINVPHGVGDGEFYPDRLTRMNLSYGVNEGYTNEGVILWDMFEAIVHDEPPFIIDDPIEREPPVEVHGQLYVCGTYLCDQNDEPVQLRGISTHGLQWYGWGNCVTQASLDALYYDWGADILRISLYVQEGGYETNPEGFTAQVNTIIEEVTDRGMYALVDWHQLTPGDPMYNLERAKTFFSDIASKHYQKTNIIYEIANEPNNVTWERVVEYADSIIPVIRQHDENAVILVGTPGWSSLGVSQGNGPQEIYNNQITIDDNIMYTFHFYAASHGQAYRNALQWAAERLPIFVSEFGTQTYTGDGANNFVSTQAYFDILDEYKISWTNWNYSHDWRSGAVWKVGTCPNGPWTEENLKESGLWIREKIRERFVSSVEHPEGLPNDFTLKQNFPNPFNPSTSIEFHLPEQIGVSIKVYDVLGRMIDILVDEVFTPGIHRVEWNPRNLPSGVYIYRAVAGDYIQSKRMMYLK